MLDWAVGNSLRVINKAFLCSPAYHSFAIWIFQPDAHDVLLCQTLSNVNGLSWVRKNTWDIAIIFDLTLIQAISIFTWHFLSLSFSPYFSITFSVFLPLVTTEFTIYFGYSADHHPCVISFRCRLPFVKLGRTTTARLRIFLPPGCSNPLFVLSPTSRMCSRGSWCTDFEAKCTRLRDVSCADLSISLSGASFRDNSIQFNDQCDRTCQLVIVGNLPN